MTQQQPKTRRKTTYKGADQKATSGLTPKTTRQKEFIEALTDSTQVFVLGPAGTAVFHIIFIQTVHN